MYQGSCLCGQIRYQLTAPIRASHCHCRMCQKQHGAAFATYVTVKLADFELLAGEELLVQFQSSPGIYRGFCHCCGSSLFWRDSCSDEIAAALASFDTPLLPENIPDIYTESRAPWCSATQHNKSK